MCLSFPTRETVEQMVSVKPAGFRASMARDGHLRGLGKAKAAPPGPGRPPHSQGTKSTASHQSSLTSLEGSGVSERLPRKSLRQAGGPHVEVGVHGGMGSEPQGAFCLWAFVHAIPSWNACSRRCQSQSCLHIGLMPNATSLPYLPPHPSFYQQLLFLL